MALPPLPANNTARHFIDYTTGRKNHSLVVRSDDGVNTGEVLSRTFDFLTELAPLLPSLWVVTGVRRQAAGSEFSLPVDPGALTEFAGTNGDNLMPIQDEPRQVTFTGRSLVTGRFTRVGVFGLIFSTPASYRLPTSGLGGIVSNALSALVSASFNGSFVAIDGANVQWNAYANVNYNSYWETEARG